MANQAFVDLRVAIAETEVPVMSYKVCEDCGCRIYEYGCVNCNEVEYIRNQEQDEKEPPEEESVQNSEVLKAIAKAEGKE